MKQNLQTTLWKIVVSEGEIDKNWQQTVYVCFLNFFLKYITDSRIIIDKQSQLCWNEVSMYGTKYIKEFNCSSIHVKTF
jgi:hypothetical protein